MTQSSINSFDFPNLHELAKKNVLIQADDQTFQTMCYMPEFKNLCSGMNEENIYEGRIRRMYTDDIIAFKENMSWKEFYGRVNWLYEKIKDKLINKESINQYAKINDLMELKLLNSINENWLPNKYGANSAAIAGHLHILKWLKQFNILPTSEGINLAIFGNQYDVAKWAFENTIFVTNTVAAIRSKDNLRMLKLLAEYNILPDRNDMIWAAIDGKLEIFKWLATIKNVHEFADGTTAEEARVKGNWDIVRWLAQYGIHPQIN